MTTIEVRPDRRGGWSVLEATASGRAACVAAATAWAVGWKRNLAAEGSTDECWIMSTLIRSMASALISVLLLGVALAEQPIKLTAEETKMENGVSVAKGNVIFDDGKVTIRGERLEYSPARNQLSCVGFAVAEINGIKIVLEDMTYDLKAKRIVSTIAKIK